MIKDNFYYILKNRLDYARDYLKDTSDYLRSLNFQKKVKREFYKDKPFLALIIKLYFLPYNLFKYFIYTTERHKLDMINKEIEILNEFQVDKNGTKLIDGESND